MSLVIDESNHSLIHYGTKGMKWGVRKNQESSKAVAKSPIKDIDWGEKKTKAIVAGTVGTLVVGGAVLAGILTYNKAVDKAIARGLADLAVKQSLHDSFAAGLAAAVNQIASEQLR